MTSVANTGTPPVAGASAGTGILSTLATAAPIVLPIIAAVIAAKVSYEMWHGFTNDAGEVSYKGNKYDLRDPSQARSYEDHLLRENPTLTRLVSDGGDVTLGDGTRKRMAEDVGTEGLTEIFTGLEARRRGSDPTEFGNSQFGQEYYIALGELGKRGVDTSAIVGDLDEFQQSQLLAMSQVVEGRGTRDFPVTTTGPGLGQNLNPAVDEFGNDIDPFGADVRGT